MAAGHVAAGASAHRRLVEVRRAPRAAAELPHHVLDQRLGVAGVGQRDGGGGRLGLWLGLGLGEVVVLAAGSGHQGERRDPARMVDAEEQPGAARHRPRHHVRPPDVQGVEDRDRVGGEVAHRVAGRAHRVGGRPSGVAVVEPDHVAAAGGEGLAELLLPPQHRGLRTVHEQDARVAPVAERLDAEVHPVRPDHPLRRHAAASAVSTGAGGTAAGARVARAVASTEPPTTSTSPIGSPAVTGSPSTRTPRASATTGLR